MDGKTSQASAAKQKIKADPVICQLRPIRQGTVSPSGAGVWAIRWIAIDSTSSGRSDVSEKAEIVGDFQNAAEKIDKISGNRDALYWMIYLPVFDIKSRCPD
jgi:hypothetical protein